ncbi:hypothetical protein BGZ49_000235, partial [Haplosporangium sp. Z 27]
MKVRMQTAGNDRFHGLWHCITETLKKEGPRAFYKGATPPLIGWAFMDRAGVTVSFVATPIEHVKARLQVQYDAKTKIYAGPVDCVRQLIRNNGITGPWKGLVATLWFRSSFFMWWGSYEIYSREMRKRTNMSDAAINFWAAGMGAQTFWFFAFPCDVVKNKIMTQPDVKNPPFPTLISGFKHVYRTDGLKGFYRGFLPCFLRAFPTNACALTSFELMMRWLRKIDQIKIRVVCARAYHCLFMRNMLIRPTDEELEEYGEPDFTILNAGAFPANRYTTGMTSNTSVSINFRRREMVILGTEYAGEMKK